MTLTGLLLIVISAVTHAYWNFRLKQAGGGNLFIALSKVAEAAVYAPLFLLWGLPTMPRTSAALVLILVSTVGVLTSYSALVQAYRHAELSYAYPISRGSMLLFLPVLGFVATREHIDVVGAAGLVLILLGVLALQLKELAVAAIAEIHQHVNGKGLGWALFTGFVLATFTLWDKHAVLTLPPFAYLYAYTVLVAIGYLAYVWKRHTADEIRAEWRRNSNAIVIVGVLNTVSYCLALFALRGGVSSYVMGVRQLSIAIGVMLGWRLLGEALTPPRKVGASLILAGCLLVSLAR